MSMSVFLEVSDLASSHPSSIILFLFAFLFFNFLHLLTNKMEGQLFRNSDLMRFLPFVLLLSFCVTFLKVLAYAVYRQRQNIIL